MFEKKNAERPYKGKSLLIFPEDYTVIDIETTGLSSARCEIIELSAIRFRRHKNAGQFTTLIKPHGYISRFITDLTGITNDMVRSAPDLPDALCAFSDFVGDDLLMGYNVNFDVNFIYDNMARVFGIPFTNDFVDVLRFARKALPTLGSRSQTEVAAHYGVGTAGAHRALRDCEICQKIYLKLRETLAETEDRDERRITEV